MDELLINAVYEEIDEIKKMDAYINMLELNKKINIELNGLIKDFSKAKEEYERVKEYGPYYMGYQEITNRLSQLREQLESEALVIEYRKNEKIVNDYLAKLNIELIKASRGEI